jgi:hypothetical protein
MREQHFILTLLSSFMSRPESKGAGALKTKLLIPSSSVDVLCLLLLCEWS